MIRKFWRWLTLADLHEQAVAQMTVRCAEPGHWFKVKSLDGRIEYSACCAKHLMENLRNGGSS